MGKVTEKMKDFFPAFLAVQSESKERFYKSKSGFHFWLKYDFLGRLLINDTIG